MATKQKSAGGSLLELVVIVAVALGLALGIQAFLVKPYRIPSESMVPTLQIGQRVLVNRLDGRFGTPEVGDIVAIEWDVYSGDHLMSYKYTAASKTWEYLEAPLHTPFYDRERLRAGDRIEGPAVIEQYDTPAAILAEPANDFVVDFLGAERG